MSPGPPEAVPAPQTVAQLLANLRAKHGVQAPPGVSNAQAASSEAIRGLRPTPPTANKKGKAKAQPASIPHPTAGPSTQALHASSTRAPTVHSSKTTVSLIRNIIFLGVDPSVLRSFDHKSGQQGLVAPSSAYALGLERFGFATQGEFEFDWTWDAGKTLEFLFTKLPDAFAACEAAAAAWDPADHNGEPFGPPFVLLSKDGRRLAPVDKSSIQGGDIYDTVIVRATNYMKRKIYITSPRDISVFCPREMTFVYDCERQRNPHALPPLPRAIAPIPPAHVVAPTPVTLQASSYPLIPVGGVPPSPNGSSVDVAAASGGGYPGLEDDIFRGASPTPAHDAVMQADSNTDDASTAHSAAESEHSDSEISLSGGEDQSDPDYSASPHNKKRKRAAKSSSPSPTPPPSLGTRSHKKRKEMINNLSETPTPVTPRPGPSKPAAAFPSPANSNWNARA